jgi:allantoinase
MVEQLWACVFDGLVDVIASDHSPCTWAEKKAGSSDIWQAWGGISGIQSLLPALLSEGVNARGLPLSQLVKMVSENPARRYGLYPRKGAIFPGADADLVLVDLNEEWTLTADQLFYKNPHSPYIGYRFRGAVKQTFVRGNSVYKDGKILAQPGSGQLLYRSNA